MFIGEASKASGLSIKAIRFYEQIGLTRQAPRRGRYRVYTKTDIELLVLIKEAKTLGISLSELKTVIVYQDADVDWQAIKVFLAQMRIVLESRIEALQLKIASLDECYHQINP